MSLLMDGLRAGLRDVCDFLFPHVCYSCRRKTRPGAPLCDSCEKRLIRIDAPLCYACDPKRVLSAKIEDGEGCRIADHADFRVASGLMMRGPVPDLIHAFKYAGARSLAGFLARPCVPGFLLLDPAPPDLLVPVPLHPSRLRQRGYNQSLLLAEEIMRLTGVTAAPGLLKRSRATRSQTGLPHHLRRENVEGAFAVPFPPTIEGKAVAVVDDVATTGATLRACAGALLAAGASRVVAVVAAIS